jgi:hypothetical protein
VHKLSDILFEELDRRFKLFFSDLHELSYSGTDIRTGVVEELTLLLRCCMVILRLLACGQNLLLEKGRVLLFIVKVLTSLDAIGDCESESERIKRRRSCFSFESVSRECGDGGCTTAVAEDFAASCVFWSLLIRADRFYVHCSRWFSSIYIVLRRFIVCEDMKIF